MGGGAAVVQAAAFVNPVVPLTHTLDAFSVPFLVARLAARLPRSFMCIHLRLF
jgi:hypothetical protein